MSRVVSAPRAIRPGPRSIGAPGPGVVLLVCGAVLAVSVPVLGIPAGALLVSVVAVSGLLLVARLPRLRSLSLAAALGAAVPLLAAAPGGGYPASAVVTAGAALAVVGVTAWRLRRRREWAPWYGTRGVLLASAAALVTLGVAVLLLEGSGVLGATSLRGEALVEAAVQTAVPLAVLVGACGWLRRPLAVALLAPSVAQLVVVVAG